MPDAIINRETRESQKRTKATSKRRRKPPLAILAMNPGARVKLLFPRSVFGTDACVSACAVAYRRRFVYIARIAGEIYATDVLVSSSYRDVCSLEYAISRRDHDK